MAKQANRMMIGGFVVIAVVLLAASLVVFGSGKFFKKTDKYVLYFRWVRQRVECGRAGAVPGRSDRLGDQHRYPRRSQQLETEIPVIIEIEPDKFQVDEGDRKRIEIPEKMRRNSSRWACGPCWRCRVSLPGSS